MIKIFLTVSFILLLTLSGIYHNTIDQYIKLKGLTPYILSIFYVVFGTIIFISSIIYILKYNSDYGYDVTTTSHGFLEGTSDLGRKSFTIDIIKKGFF